MYLKFFCSSSTKVKNKTFQPNGSYKNKQDTPVYMPELPEVETYRRYLEGTIFHQTITDFEIDDPKKLLLIPLDEFVSGIKNRQIVGSKRVGKNLFLRLDNDEWLYMHFGMSGDVHYYRDDTDRPKHARIVFYFDSGFKLGFICPRKFERLSVVRDAEAFLKKKKVNADVMDITFAEFKKQLNKRKSVIKSVLLDQSVVAGVGNWIVDEVLFQARVNPTTKSDTLSDARIRLIFNAMQNVVKLAIEKEANYVHFPNTYLIHARGWGKPEYDTSCPNCEKELKVEKVGGRTTYFCSSCQP
jgi:formamidopyrimidine-DNA glycosylase